MIKRRLGRTNFEVTSLGLGCFQITGEYDINPKDSAELLDYAMESEINLFDTAAMYGFGESEEIVGRSLSKYPSKEAFVSTKVGYLHDRTVTRSKGYDAYLEPVEIRRAIKHSMWLLRQDSLDMLLIHEADWDCWQLDHKTGQGIIMTVLEELKKEGLVKNIGIGVTEYYKNAQLIDTGKIDIALVAGGISLLGRPIFDELIPAARKHDTGIMVGAGFGMGNKFLTAKRRDDLPELLESDDNSRVVMGLKLKEIYDLSDELNMDLFEMALRYILSFEDIHSHCAGARELDHLKMNIEYIEKGPLSNEVVEAINSIQERHELPKYQNMMALFGKPPGFLSD